MLGKGASTFPAFNRRNIIIRVIHIRLDLQCSGHDRKYEHKSISGRFRGYLMQFIKFDYNSSVRTET